MAGNITLTMIKPTALGNGNGGSILKMIQDAGFRIAALRMLQLTEDQAKKFYAIHASRPFFQGLVQFMTSGPIIAALLEKDNAVEDFRALIGATNPDEAGEGTVRRIFGKNVQENAVHGSDSDENARREAAFFFSELERF
jgi:nucleoside-diphosphate kinase